MGAPRLSSTPLPGIRVRYDLTTREQRRLSVVLTSGEAAALVDALGRLLGETRMRTETGVCVVAVLRRAEAIPSPAPDFRLSATTS